ncbi:MAG TPA: hypothetical protein PLS03_02415 [Terrimicrobiaceae bacterium]|nr:hypothetical protein [Terrimicrobiaceae bacterium]
MAADSVGKSCPVGGGRNDFICHFPADRFPPTALTAHEERPVSVERYAAPAEFNHPFGDCKLPFSMQRQPPTLALSFHVPALDLHAFAKCVAVVNIADGQRKQFGNPQCRPLREDDHRCIPSGISPMNVVKEVRNLRFIPKWSSACHAHVTKDTGVIFGSTAVSNWPPARVNNPRDGRFLSKVYLAISGCNVPAFGV